MSNSSELFLSDKDNEEDTKFDILKRSNVDVNTSQDSNKDRQQNHEPEGKDDDNQKEEEEKEFKSAHCMSLVELKATEDDNDGFKTPTSLDHKIPVPTVCPPAPRKPIKPLLSTKRKVRRRLQFDLSQEVDSLLPGPVVADFNKKMKKARRDHNETST